MNKPELIFTFPAKIGGVSSFNFNIINYSTLKSKFYLKVILIKQIEDNSPVFNEDFLADEVIFFKYSVLENQYYVQRRLNALLGNGLGLIVTDNALTLNAADRFKNPKTIFHLLHDFFYVKQNFVFTNVIDVSIAHSSFFSDAVFASNPLDWAGRSIYLPYGVKKGLFRLNDKPESNKLNLLFLGRLDDGKGVHLLFEIEQILIKNNVQVNWVIVGKGPLKKNLLATWEKNDNIKFFEPNSTNEVYEIIRKQDIFIFPTSFEGTPVSILECLANGVVTIVNDLPGGIRDIVSEDVGFRCQLNDIEQFASIILFLHNNRSLLKIMQQNCIELFNKSFDIEKNADNYFEIFSEYNSLKREKIITIPIPMSRLDNRYIPNTITKLLRRLK